MLKAVLSIKSGRINETILSCNQIHFHVTFQVSQSSLKLMTNGIRLRFLWVDVL